MTDQASFESFVDKWRQHWPEWGLLSVFVPSAQRARLAAWMSLLQELREAAWGGRDPTPGLAKLAWWQEELLGWARGARRHPLGDALHRLDVRWDLLGRALAVLPATRAPETPDADESALRTFAAAVLACEADLFDGGEPGQEDVIASVHFLRAERALVQGDDVELRASRMLQSLENARGASLTRPRRLQHAIVRERLRLLAARGGAGRSSPLKLLLAGWRAARGG
ncbi:MAG TPA: hypothetical protein PK743_05200 [Luteimonas sp.]|nr:hypothetical protein [Luteimonas sp.]HRO27671.1 hypothetical protein [Luteimonas sp.]HRP72017.1 hypothetical protein [Luteimonas sp.]